MAKYHKLYNILKCPSHIKIPTNDTDAWKKYPQYRWVYNRLELAQFQFVENAPLPIKPSKYPIIVKPIINLYGMGLNIKKINNEKEFDKIWYNNNFWMEFFEGEQYSYDLIIRNGKIEYHACFHGIKNKKYDGVFQYWVSVERDIPNIAHKLVNDKMKEYTGCLNVEMIGENMIECHLRMGDIDIFPTFDILKGVIAIFEGKEYDWSIVNTDPVYFIPLWIKSNYTQELYNYLKDNILPLLSQNSHIHDCDIDGTHLSGPGKCKRILNFTCSNKEFADCVLDEIKKKIKNHCNITLNFI